MAEFVVTGPDGKEYEVTAPEGASESEVIRQVKKHVTAQQPVQVEGDNSPGFVRRTGDVVTGVVTGIPKALGALTSLGSAVPYVNVVADPLAQGLYDIGEYGDEALLSDYQQEQNQILSARIQDAASQLDQISEDAPLSEKMEFVYDTMVAQGGEAAEYISENPSQVFNLIGQTLPHIFLGGAVGKGLKTAGAVKTAGTAGAVGEGAIAGGDAVASIVRDQRAEGDYDYDPSRLYGLAAGVGTGLISRGGATLNPVDVDTLAAGGAKDLLGKGTDDVVKNTAKGLATEGAEEFLQSGQEQAFTNLGTGDPVYEGVGSSAVLGAATGAPLGAGVNLYSSLQNNPREEIDEQGANERALAEQQLRDQQQQEEADEARRVGLARANAAKDFIPFKTFEKQRNEAELASVLDPASEVNEEFMLWVANTRGPDKPYPQTEAEFKKEAKDFIKENSNGTEAEVAWDEYQAQLDDHVAFKEAAAQRSPEEAAQVTQTATDLLARRATAQQANDVDALAAVEQEAATALAPGEWRNAKYVADGLVVSKPEGKDAPKKPEAPEAGTAPNIEAAQAPEVDAQTTAPAAPVAPKKPTKRERLYEETTELLGENWEESNPELSQLISDGKSIYAKKKGEKSRFEKMRDKIVAENAPTVDTTPVEQPEVQDTAPEQLQAPEQAPTENVPETTPKVVEGELLSNTSTEVAPASNPFELAFPEQVKLSKNQQKVYDVLSQAFANNEQDDIMEPDGTLNHKRIAEKAGLNSRQAAREAIKQLQGKVAKQYGISESDIKQRLAETRVQNVEEFDVNATDQVFDNADLGNGSGTLASVNQGAYTGVSPEEKALTQAQEPTPIQQQTPEQLSAIRAEFDKEMRADSAYKPAADLWDNGFESDVENEADRIPFESMDAGSRLEWMTHATDYNDGNIDLDALGQEYDFIRADFIKDTENAQREITDQSGQIESPANPQEADPTGREVREEGARLEQSEERVDGEQSPEQDNDGGVAYVDGKLVVTGSKPVVTVRKPNKGSKTRFSRDGDKGKSEEPLTVEKLKRILRQVLGSASFNLGIEEDYSVDAGPGSIYSPIQVHKNPQAAAKAMRNAIPVEELETAQAFIDPRDETVVHFIASNMTDSGARGVIYHEVGVHLGIEGLMDEDTITALSMAVEQWADAEAGSVERSIYERAMARVAFARTSGMDSSLAGVELVAYAVEEAVNMGVEPSKESQSLAAAWLADVEAFFIDLLGKLKVFRKGVKVPSISAENLVALAQGAAHDYAINPATVQLESGATTRDSEELMAYYAGVDKGRSISETAQITDPDGADLLSTLKGEDSVGAEEFSWGEDSKFGPYSNIKTNGVYTDEEFGFHVVVRDGRGEVITYVSLYDEGENIYQLVIEAVEDSPNTSEVKGVKGNTWNRIEGVKHSENMRLLTEARRRLTRANDGLVPNVIFDRVTGLAAGLKATTGDSGRRGFLTDTELKTRFSKKAPPSDQESQTNTALGKVLGGDSRAAQLTANVKQAYKTPLSSLKPMSRVVRDNKEAMPSAGRFHEALYQQEQTVQEELLKVEEILLAARELPPKALAAMNDFISKSTFYQKWGYDTKVDGKDVKADPIMKREFDTLTPEAQEIAKNIFEYNEEMRKAMQKEAEDRGVKGVFKASKLKGPYAPLKRFGEYVTVLKSQDVLDLEAQLKENPKNRQLEKRLDEMKSKEEHYVVSFFDTMGEAVKFKEANKARYAASKEGAQAFEKSVGEFENRVTNPEAFAAVMGAIGADDKAGLDDKTKQNVQKIVEKLFYETLDEQNARLSGIKRENRAGYEKDMVRSFVSHAQSQARLLAQLRHGAEINQALRDMKQEASKNREELQEVANILQLKYNNLLTRDERGFAALQDAVTSFNSMYMLTTNVAYHIANATQPAISQAKIAGDFGNYSGSWGALNRGYKEAMDVVDSSLLKQLGTVTTVGMIDMGNTVQLNVENAKPEHRALLKKLQLRQMLDVGIENDLNMEAVFDTGYETINTASKAFRDMSHRLYQSSRYVEAYNRVAVAVAAYDMAVKNPAALKRMNMTPEEYAISVVEDTQGNYSYMDAPLAIDALPKITTQFRKFQIIMGWLWGTTLRDALPLNGKSKEERAAARRTLAYLGANVSALAGVKGLPFAGFIGSAALMAFGDDGEEEPKDLERWMRENFEDEALVDLLTRGAPTLLGVDLSAKLQQRDIFLPLNPEYIDTSPDAEPSKNVMFNLAFGPTAGLIGNIDRAYDQYARGDISRAVEYLLPRGQRSALESLRFAQEGYSLKNGDVILDPTSLDMKELVKNALGLTPLELSKVKWTYGQQIELKNHFTDEQARMKRDYKRARADRDKEAMAELRSEWRDLQKQKDRVRSFFNDDINSIPRSPMSDMLKAHIQQDRRERRKKRQLGVD